MRKGSRVWAVVALAAAFAVPAAHADTYHPGDYYSPGANSWTALPGASVGWTSISPDPFGWRGSSWSRLRPNPIGMRLGSLAKAG